MEKVTDGVVDVIVYPSASDKSKNRGFAFVEYETHRLAAMARRKLINGRIDMWGHNIAVDWAEPETEVDEEIMAQVRWSTVTMCLKLSVYTYSNWLVHFLSCKLMITFFFSFSILFLSFSFFKFQLFILFLSFSLSGISMSNYITSCFFPSN